MAVLAGPEASRTSSTGLSASPRLRVSASLLVFALAIFALALAPRWVARDTYVTADEDNWMRRAGGFAWGLANGRPGRTYQNGHPGVLTMELAILGQGPGGAERFADPVTGEPRVVTRVPGFFEGLVEARRAFALATATFVSLAALVTWRLFGPGAGVVGGLLLALDPFYLAHSQLVHLDAALTATMTLAVLCGLVRWSGGGRGWVLAGGALSGLALLAKSPGVYLGLAIPLLALALGRRSGRKALGMDLGLWGLAAAGAFVLFWPSMWVNPVSTLERMVAFARETGGQPHEQGSFFLGRAVADPGPLFYLVAVPLRLSPATLVGLLALALVGWRARDALGPGHWRVVLALLGYVVGFGLLMSLGAKKFDRYLLPAFPVLDLLAGLGLWLASRMGRGGVKDEGRLKSALGGKVTDHGLKPVACLGPEVTGHGLQPVAWRSIVPTVLAAVVVAVAAWPHLSVAPYYLAYYNPLLGGAPAATRVIPVGEGEGLKEAAAWLNAQPNATDLTVVSHSFDALQATFVGGGQPLRDRVPSSADFVVLYHYQSQIGHAPEVLVEYASRQPEHVVRLNGVDYVRIYRGPHGVAGDAGTRGRGDAGI